MKFIDLFTLKHSKLAYRIDMILYVAASMALAAFLIIAAPPRQWVVIVVCVLIGLLSWTLIEYLLHRFVLHGLQPFSTWHALHHRHPAELICTPTLLSLTLIGVLVFLPVLMLGGWWRAWALTLGVLSGYLAYSITHHAIHHWRANNTWSKRRKYLHALHHNAASHPGYYGVTSPFWDCVFGTNHHPGSGD